MEIVLKMGEPGLLARELYAATAEILARPGIE